MKIESKARNVMMAIAMSAYLSTTFFAANAEAPQQVSPINVVKIKQPWSSSEFKIKAADTPKVFLIAIDDKFTSMDAIRGQFKDKLTAKGFKIVDNIDEANIALAFWSDHIAAANAKAAENKLNTNEIAGQVGAAIATGGLSVVGNLLNNETRAVLHGELMKNPTIADASTIVKDKRYKGKDGSGWSIGQQVMDYKMDKKTPEVNAAVVDTLFDAWMKAHIVE